MGTSSLAEYQHLHRVADEARLKSEQARLAHRCGRVWAPGIVARDWKGVLISDTFAAFDLRQGHLPRRNLMFRSLRGRLIVLLVLLVAAACAAGLLMVGLFRQSAIAQAGQAEAEIGRACDAIGGAYRFYSAGWQGPAAGSNNDALRRDLTTVVQTALRDRPGSKAGSGRAMRGHSPMPSRPTRDQAPRPMCRRPSFPASRQ